MEIDDKDTGVKIAVKEPEQTPKQQLISKCNEIAMGIIGERTRKSGKLDWDFQARRRLERLIEERICTELYLADPKESPKVRLVRDGKSKLVSLELSQRVKPSWGERLKKKPARDS